MSKEMPAFDDNPSSYGEIHVVGLTRTNLLQLLATALPDSVEERADVWTSALAVSIRGGGFDYTASRDGSDLVLEVSPVLGADPDKFSRELVSLVQRLRESGARLEFDLPPALQAHLDSVNESG